MRQNRTRYKMSVFPSIDFPGFHLVLAFGGNSAVLTDFLLETQFQWEIVFFYSTIPTCRHLSTRILEQQEKRAEALTIFLP